MSRSWYKLLIGVFFLWAFIIFAHPVSAAFSVSLSVSPTTGIAGETSFQPAVNVSGGSFPYTCRLYDAVNGYEYATFSLATGASTPQLSSWKFTSEGSRTFVSSCTDSTGATAQSASVPITISANPNAIPPTVTAWSDKTSIGPGEIATLQWKAENVNSCYLSPEAVSLPVFGARAVSPSVTTNYSVICFGVNNMTATSDVVTIVVQGSCANGGTDYPTCTPPPPIEPFCGNYTVDPGEECDSVLGGPGALGDCPAVCSKTCRLNNCPVANTGTLNFLGRGTGTLGTSVTVQKGEAITLEWESTGKSYCNIASAGGYQSLGDPNWSGSMSGAELTKGSRTFTPSGVGRFVYHMCQLNQFDWMGTVTVTVTDPPVVDFWANPVEIDPGQSTALGWKVTNIRGVGNTITCSLTASGSTATLWSASLPKTTPLDANGKLIFKIDDTELSGEKTVSPSTTTRYVLQCTRIYVDENGNQSFSIPKDQVTKNVVVRIKGTTDPFVGKVELCATSNWFFPDGSRHPVTFNWKTKNIASCQKKGSSNSTDNPAFAQYLIDPVFSGTLTGSDLLQGSYNTVLGGTGNYSLTCRDLDGNAISARAFVYIDTRIPKQSDVSADTPAACPSDFIPSTPNDNTGPSTSLSCPTGSSPCQSGTTCSNGAQRIASCNNGLGSCCATPPLQGAGPNSGSVQSDTTDVFFNPLKFDSIEGVLTAVMTQLKNIIVILSIIFIIIGAVMYILSAGNESRMNTAKGAITASLIGLTLAIAAPAFLKEIAAILGWTNVTDASNTIAGAQTFTQIAKKVLDFLLSIVGIIAIIMLVFGGFTYLTSAGDEKKAETGKKIVIYAIIAIAIALSALVLVTQVAKFFA